MSVTLSHTSALNALRKLRTAGSNVREMDSVDLRGPSLWKGKRWTSGLFKGSEWKWAQPSASDHLHVMKSKDGDRIRMENVDMHKEQVGTPPKSWICLDNYCSMVCPELLFLQMASTLSLPDLVYLGYELCGHFSLDAQDPLGGNVTMGIPPATTVEDISHYLSSLRSAHGIAQARHAISFVTNNAMSAPEAVLGTMYSLPAKESGYGMGPVTLNQRVRTNAIGGQSSRQSRYPDIMFSFAPVGINYDGEGHLDLTGLVQAAMKASLAEAEGRPEIKEALEKKQGDVRDKAVDDMVRDRQLLAQGRIVLPATKEDLYGWGNLDNFTLHLLACAHAFFGVDTSEYVKVIEDTDKQRDRYDLLTSLLPRGTQSQFSSNEADEAELPATK